jgi:hypothetical protein
MPATNDSAPSYIHRPRGALSPRQRPQAGGMVPGLSLGGAAYGPSESDPDDKWAWLCLNCLAHNTEASTKCQDCRVRRGTDAEGIACADGADCSSCRCDQRTLNALSTHSQLTLN